MKIDWNKRYTSIAAYASLVVAGAVLLVFICMDLHSFLGLIGKIFQIFAPIVIGATMAYVLTPCVKFFENHVFRFLNKKKKYRMKRTFSVVVVILLVLCFLIGIVFGVVPGVIHGYEDLKHLSGMYLDALREWILGISFDENQIFGGYLEKILEYVVELVDKIYGIFDVISPDIASFAGSLVGIITDTFLGVILAIYFLFSKEKLLAEGRKFFRAFLNDRNFIAMRKSVRITSEKFGGFLKKQVTDCIIIGTLSYFSLYLIGVPYYPLVSVLVGLAMFIPFFGPVAGILAGAVIIFIADPLEALWFVLFMILLHTVNRYLIRPRFIHARKDVTSAFMMTAIIVMTGFFGFWGLIFGVPAFAVLYVFIHAYVNKRLEKRGISTKSEEYYATDTGRALYEERQKKKERYLQHFPLAAELEEDNETYYVGEPLPLADGEVYDDDDDDDGDGEENTDADSMTDESADADRPTDEKAVDGNSKTGA